MQIKIATIVRVLRYEYIVHQLCITDCLSCLSGVGHNQNSASSINNGFSCTWLFGFSSRSLTTNNEIRVGKHRKCIENSQQLVFVSCSAMRKKWPEMKMPFQRIFATLDADTHQSVLFVITCAMRTTRVCVCLSLFLRMITAHHFNAPQHTLHLMRCDAFRIPTGWSNSCSSLSALFLSG